MRLLVLLLVPATAAASPWRADPGPPLLAAGYAQKVTTLDDGRVMVDAGSLPQVFDGSAWHWLGDKVVTGLGPSARIPGGVLVARGAFLGHPGRGGVRWDGTSWHDTGGLIVEREYEAEERTATLADGSVLVVGGTQDKSPRVLAEAERWTAKADAFAPAGSLRTPRRDFTLTALPDGRALASGGADDYGRGHWSAQCDVYDPKTNTWKPTGDLHIARRGHTATVLPDGRVLVAGGQDRDEKPIAEVEIWDPSTGAWTIAAKLREPRSYHAAVLLPRSRVMFVGGTRGDDLYVHFGNGTAVLSAETYDALNGRWEPVWYPPHAYEKPVIAPLPDGRLVVAGGYSFTTGLTTVELWTPAPGPDAPWELATTPTHPPLALPAGYEDGSTATSLPDGGVLAVGGNEWRTLDARRFDPATRTWTDVPIHAGRLHHVAVPLPDGRVLIAGGSGHQTPSARVQMSIPPPPAVLSAEVFDPATGKLSRTGPPTRSHVDAAAAVLADGRVLVTGGGTSVTEVWSPKTGRFTRVASMHASRRLHTATRLPDGRVAVIGGDAKGTYEVYDPANNTWSPLHPLPEPWTGHTAELAPDGRVLVTVGGRTVALRID